MLNSPKRNSRSYSEREISCFSDHNPNSLEGTGIWRSMDFHSRRLIFASWRPSTCIRRIVMFERSATTSDTSPPVPYAYVKTLLAARKNSDPPSKAVVTPPRGGNRLSKLPLPWRVRLTARTNNQAHRGRSSASMACKRNRHRRRYESRFSSCTQSRVKPTVLVRTSYVVR